MANRNNDSRVTPNETVNINLQPQAAPVDKTISYQPDLTAAKQSAATADSLAKLGQGMLNYDGYLRREANDAVLTAVADSEAEGGNKKEWADVSKNIDGLAKFNPYIKDSYKTLTAQDIYRSSVLKLSSNPNLEKMESSAFNKFVGDTKTEMLSAFKESGLDPSNYVNFVEKFSKDVYATSQVYSVKNSEYNYQNSLVYHSSDLGFQLGVNAYNAKSTSSKTEAITVALNTKLDKLSVLGVPKDDAAKVLTSGIQSYIIDNAESLSSTALEASVKDLKIYGQPINEIVPNYAYAVHQLVNQAKRTKFDERKADYEDKQLTLAINTKDANKEFFSWYKQNQSATPAALQTQALGLVTKFGLQEDGFGFLAEVVKDRSILTKLKTVESNPNVQQELGALAVTGKLTGQRIETELLNGNLNIDDGLKLHDRIDRDAKAEVKALDTDLKTFDTQLKDTGIYGTQLKRDSTLLQMRNKVNQLKIDVDNGTITKEVAQQKANEFSQYMAEYTKFKTNRNKDASLLLNGTYVRNQPYPTYNFNKASNAFKNIAYLRGGYGQKINGNITSGINPNRVINGKKSPHGGYDLGANEGQAILNCNMSGTVIKAGYLDDFGNYLIIKYNNGTYARMGHLQNNTSSLVNKSIAANQKIGYVGHTGFATGSHLHADFFDRNLTRINAETFAKGL